MHWAVLIPYGVAFGAVLLWLGVEVYIDRKAQREWRELLHDRDESGRREARKPPKIYL